MYMYSLIMTSQHMHHTLGFSAAITAALWRARELQQKLLFAEPRGLEETCDAVLHVHQLVVYTPNSAGKVANHTFEVRKIRPSDGLFCHSAIAF